MQNGTVGLFSEEARECETCRASGFTLTFGDLTITDPGKFQGENLSTYHAYHVMLDGFADDDDGPSWRIGNVICVESSDGFVSGESFPTNADAINSWDDNA